MTEEDKILQEVTTTDYKYGFVTDIDSDTIKKGLNEDVIRLISMKKNEPDWLLEWRLDAFRKFQKMTVFSLLVILKMSWGVLSTLNIFTSLLVENVLLLILRIQKNT